MNVKLTERVVNDLVPSSVDVKVFDTKLPGFHVRVSPRGTKTYSLFYRNADGRQRTIKIGRAATMKCEQARERAMALLVDVQEGRDPSAARRIERSVVTMEDLYADYLAKHARVKKRASSVKMDEILWRLHLAPSLAELPVAEVGRRALDSLMASMSGKRGAANRAMALLSKMMALAVAWELRPDNPCRGVDRYEEVRKERFLTPAEVLRLNDALEEEADLGASNAIRLLLLTGARRSEVLLAEWGQFDLDSAIPIWTVPRFNHKGGGRTRSDLRRPLSDEVANLLRRWKASCPVVSLRWVFPSPRDATKPRADLNSVWKRVRKKAGLPEVRLHDLRHSFASAAVNQGASLFSIGKNLGHADVRTTERYAHLMDDSIRDVAQSVANVFGERRTSRSGNGA